MPLIRNHKKVPTPVPYRTRILSPLPNLSEMWERPFNPPLHAVYSANVQTRAWAQREGSVTISNDYSLPPGRQTPWSPPSGTIFLLLNVTSRRPKYCSFVAGTSGAVSP